MSKPATVGASDFHPAAQAKKEIKITAAVKNKTTGKWEAKDLSNKEKKINAGIKQVISQLGAETQRLLDEKGGHIELGSAGIYVPRGKLLVNALDDERMTGRKRAQAKKTIETILKDVRTEAGDEVIIFVDVLEVGRLPTLEKTHDFYQDAEALKELLDSEKGQGLLLFKGHTSEGVQRASSRITKLAESIDYLNKLEIETEKLISEGKLEEACRYFTENFPGYYYHFCADMREWGKEQRAIGRLFAPGENNLFELDLEVFQLHANYANGIFSQAEVYPSQKEILAEAKKTLHESTTDFIHFIKLQEASEKNIGLLIEKEEAFITSIQKGLHFLEKNESVQQWPEQDITAHRHALVALKEKSDALLKELRKVRGFFIQGSLQEGMDNYILVMEKQLPDYEEALAGLVLSQSLAKGRILTREHQNKDLLVDQNQMQYYETFLASMSDAASQANLRPEVLDSTAWAESLAIIRKHKDTVERLSKPSVLAFNANDDQRGNLLVEQRLEQFVSAYTMHRERFEHIMRAHGVSDLESAYLFNFTLGTYEAVRNWNQRYQEVVDLINKGEFEEAAQKYTDLMAQEFPRMARPFQNSLLPLGRSGSSVLEAFSEFMQTVGRTSSYQILTEVTDPRTFGKFNEKFKGFVKRAEEANVALPNNVDDVLRNSQETVDLLNANAKQFEYLFTQDEGFKKLFELGKNLQTPQLEKEWRAILKKYGWDSQQIRKIQNISNEYAALIQRFKEGEQAVAVERNPQKQRALKAQLKELAKALKPEVERLNQEFAQLGGFKHLRDLQHAGEEMAPKIQAHGEQIRQELKKAYYAKRETFLTMGFANEEDFIARFEEVILTSSTISKSGFARELFLLKQLKLTETLSLEADRLNELMGMRFDYLNVLYQDLNLISKLAPGKVERLFLMGAHAKDEIFFPSLAGWDEGEIRRFSVWYDAYMGAYYPLNAARSAWEADPENPILQHEFNKVAKEQIPKLTRLSKAFTANFGLERLRNLEDGLQKYIATKQLDLEAKKNQLAMTSNPRTQAILKKSIKTLEASFERLKSVDFVARILDSDKEIASTEKIVRVPMSWDPSFLDRFTSARSPLFEPKIENKSLWADLLQEKNLTDKDLAAISKLYKNFQMEMEKIATLERRLEARPHDYRLRAELIKEMSARGPRLEVLGRQLDKISPKISRLQEAVDEYNTTLSQEISIVQRGIEEEISLGGLTILQKGLRDMHAAYDEAIALTSDVNIEDAFAKLRLFARESYKRFL